MATPAFKIKVSATGPVSPPKASRKILALSLASPPAKSFNSHFFIPTLDGSKVYVLTPSLETSMTSAGPHGVNSSKPIEWTINAFFIPKRMNESAINLWISVE